MIGQRNFLLDQFHFGTIAVCPGAQGALDFVFLRFAGRYVGTDVFPASIGRDAGFDADLAHFE